jgi:membrane protein implicated in regulation of membrane protease activity
MWELFVHSYNLIFSLALCIMLLIGLLEIVLLVIGGGSQGFLEQFLPEGLEHGQVEVSLDKPQSLTVYTFDWLGIGRLPLLIWLVVFLTTFALFGYIIQGILYSSIGYMITPWLIAPISLMFSAPILHWSSRALVRLMPRDETTAIYSDELIGRTATIILGTAKRNSPAQARVKDQHGQTHYVMVEPETDESYIQGQDVVLTQKTNVGFQAISLDK